jgi:hypothetical protein
MEAPTYLLFILGCLGAADIALFHSVAHGIRSHPNSVKELFTHSLRGPTYAALFVIVPNFQARGWFAWAVIALFVFDVGISIWDFSLEQGSRRLLGGLPSGEYVLHMFMAMLFGGFVASFLYCAENWFHAPTEWIYAPTSVPNALRLTMSLMAVLVLASGLQDAGAALRLKAIAVEPVRDIAAEEVTSLGKHLRFERFVTSFPAIPEASPAWARIVLVVAGIYNLVWGLWVVLFPGAAFRWIGIEAINYPQIWQCVGMIVGVYGVGYLIAARNPLRHWPIVFVGLLGKILGPAGMYWSIMHGCLPLSMGLLCLTNDLVWWLPFGLVLGRAFRLHQEAERQLQ